MSPQHSVVDWPQQVASDTEEILGDPMHRQEPLRLSHGFELSHASFPLSGRLMGDFRSIVRVSVGVMDDGRHDRSLRCSIAPQLVGNQPPGLASLAFQQHTEETFSRTPIATQLEEDVDHITVLVNGAPEIVLLPPNVHEEFIQVPRIAQPTLATLERTSVHGTELQTPQSDGLVSDDDPPLCQEILDVSEA
jgi:hypothetical protein